MKILLSLFLLLSSFLAFGQGENMKEDSIFYEKIIMTTDSIESFMIENLNQGIVSEKNIKPMKRILKDYHDFLLKFPQSDYKFSALNEKAFTEFYLQEYNNAKNSYLEILKFVQENKELKDPFLRVPYSQDDRYLNHLYHNLADVEIKTKNYEQAIKYLDEVQKNSYRISCGNGLYPEIANIANSYSECYLNLKDDEKICDVLIPVAALPMLNEGSVTVTRLYKTLLKKYKKEELKKLFEESFKTIHTKEGIINAYSGTIYYVKFLNRDVILYDSFKNLSKRETKEKLNKVLHYSKFYALLSK